MKRSIRYSAVCVDGNHTVISTDCVNDFEELDNGFMFKFFKKWNYSPYFYQSDDLEKAWTFANNAKEAEES